MRSCLRPSALLSAVVRDRSAERLTLGLELAGGRRARLEVAIADDDRVTFELEPEREPLRVAIDWRRRSDEHFVGLGARHGTQLDQAGRVVQLGADRRYTGPDCPAELLAGGGIPQGDCAPVPWLVSSRRYAAWVRSEANGVRFDLAGDRVGASTRASAGPLVLELFCHPTPGGAPARVLPVDGLSRRPARVGIRVLEEPRRLRAPGRRGRGLRGHDRPRHTARRDRARFAVGDPVQHLAVQPIPVPRRGRADPADAGGRRANRGVGDAVGQPRLARRAGPAAARIRAASPRAGIELRRRGRRRPLRCRAVRRAVRDPMVDGHRLAGRLHEPGRRGVVAGAGQ